MSAQAKTVGLSRVMRWMIMLAIVAAIMICLPVTAAQAKPPNIPCVTDGVLGGVKCLANPGGTILNAAAGAAADNAADSAVAQMASALITGWDQMTKQFLTSWIQDSGLLIKLDGSSVTWLTSALRYLTVFLATIGVMIACAWTMWHRRGEKIQQAVSGLFMVLLVTGLGSALVQVLIPTGDAFGKWILSQTNVDAKVAMDQTQLVANFAGIAIVGGLIGTLATFFQWVLMLIRAVVVPLLVAIWPTAAAASMIQGASAALPKVTQWLFAFLLYKPAAAIVYAFAWETKNEDGLKGLLNGLALTILAVFALPALVRLIAPAVERMGAVAGGAMALQAAGGLVAAGATVIPIGGAVAGGATRAAAAKGAGAAGAGPGGGGSPMAGGAGPSTPAGGGGGLDLNRLDGGSGGGGRLEPATDSPAAGSGGGSSPGSSAAHSTTNGPSAGAGSQQRQASSPTGAGSASTAASAPRPAGAGLASSGAGNGSGGGGGGARSGGSATRPAAGAPPAAGGAGPAGVRRSAPLAGGGRAATGAGQQGLRDATRRAGGAMASGADKASEAIDGGEQK